MAREIVYSTSSKISQELNLKLPEVASALSQMNRRGLVTKNQTHGVKAAEWKISPLGKTIHKEIVIT